MKNFKFTTCFLLLFSMFLFTNCEININEDEECLKCEYVDNDRTISEEVCDPSTEEEKQEMRSSMKSEADSLGVIIDCFRR